MKCDKCGHVTEDCLESCGDELTIAYMSGQSDSSAQIKVLEGILADRSMNSNDPTSAADSYYHIAELLEVPEGGSVCDTAQGLMEENKALRGLIVKIHDDLRMRAEIDSNDLMVVDLSASIWDLIKDVLA